MMAADLQDPPEVIGAMLGEWRKGARVVWATRRVRPGERTHAGFAALYYWIMRRVVGMTDMPERGADFFLIDRAGHRCVPPVRRAQHERARPHHLDRVSSSGDRVRQAAQGRGRSGWTLARKVTLVVDSVTAFSDLPVRLCAYAGIALVVAGLLA
jgi:dolichol-phosphate mannosyltransferase